MEEAVSVRAPTFLVKLRVESQADSECAGGEGKQE